MKPSELKEGETTEIITNGILRAAFVMEYGGLDLIIYTKEGNEAEGGNCKFMLPIRFNDGKLTPELADEIWKQIQDQFTAVSKLGGLWRTEKNCLTLPS